MEVRLKTDKKPIKPPVEISKTFQLFLSDLVKREVKSVLNGLAEEGVKVGRKDIKKSRKKIENRIIAGDKGRERMDPGTAEKIKAYIKSYLIHRFVKAR